MDTKSIKMSLKIWKVKCYNPILCSMENLLSWLMLLAHLRRIPDYYCHRWIFVERQDCFLLSWEASSVGFCKLWICAKSKIRLTIYLDELKLKIGLLHEWFKCLLTTLKGSPSGLTKRHHIFTLFSTSKRLAKVHFDLWPLKLQRRLNPLWLKDASFQFP